ncbi:MAG: Wzz/FepE/Etk N-terminal domain-containing protein [Thermodesulfovibrionales bacterium]|nr:Wzz/FepE/Etk N-terminal domain-containing protein [Thermodesulfovibrionales bacterium]
METHNKGTATYNDEINLYDYWKVIVKRKTLIIGLFLAAVLASAVISFLTPKIYRGEVVLKLPAKELTAKELTNIIGKIDGEKKEKIFLTTYHLVADVKLNALKDSADKLQLIIESKNTDAIPSAMTEFAAYLNYYKPCC